MIRAGEASGEGHGGSEERQGTLIGGRGSGEDEGAGPGQGTRLAEGSSCRAKGLQHTLGKRSRYTWFIITISLSKVPDVRPGLKG